MHLVPRLQEKHILSVSGEEMSVNALGFAGMILVKNQEEARAVREEGVTTILR